MLKRIVFCLAICAIAVAGAAEAQRGGGGGRHGHGGGSGGDGGHSSPSTASSQPPAPEKAENAIEIIGVVRAIDPQGGRVTIDYEPVEAFNWPRGSMPFVVSKTDLLQGVTVGEKVRFRLDSQQISSLKPF